MDTIKKPIISIIAAISQDRALGKNNKLLWHIPKDLARFKKITTGHPVIMGRTTFESLGKPLPGRTNIIITRDDNYQAEGCIICHSLEGAINIAKEKDHKEVFVIGGGQIYNQTINLADKLYLTLVKGKFDADTYFPDYSVFRKIIFQKEGYYKQYQYTFLELVR